MPPVKFIATDQFERTSGRLTVHVTFPTDLIERIYQLPKKFQRQVWDKAWRAGLKFPREMAKQILATEAEKWSEGMNDQGVVRKKLKQTLIYKSQALPDRNTRVGAFFAIIGHNYKITPHAHLVEKGTNKRWQITAGISDGKPTGKKFLVFPPPKTRPRQWIRGRVYKPSVIHGPIRGHHHIERSFNATTRQVLGSFFRRAKPAINEELKNLAKDYFRRDVRKHLGKLPPGAKLKFQLDVNSI